MQRTRAALTGVASYLPEGRLTNETLATSLPRWTAEKISEKTGIDSRHLAAQDEFTSDLAIQAARNLFELDPAHREEIDLIILVTVTPDYTVPPTAPFIQAALDLPTTVGAFEILMGCSGYTYALGLAAGMIESGRMRKVLLLTADRFTPMAEHGTHGESTIFGDAAAASMIERVDEGDPRGGIIGLTRIGTDGVGAKNLIIPTSGLRGFVGQETTEAPLPTLEMNGPEVFDFSLKLVPGHVRSVLEEAGLGVDDVDLFVLHQANAFMLEHLRKRLRIPEERFVLHMSEVGNTISSSIPIALEAAMLEGRVQPGHRVMFTAFGTGYSWGSVLLEYAS